jgi:hypothetical protein
MRRVGRLWHLLAATAIVLLALPAIATANPLGFPFHVPAGVPPQLRALLRTQAAPNASHTPFHPGFELKARNGYRLGVIGIAPDVVAFVIRSHAGAETAYVARGTVTPNRLQASFGKYGKVAMRFQPSRNRTWVKPHRSCRGGGRFMVRRGVYVGSVRFTGEDGYLSVRSHHAKGLVSSVAPQCERGRAHSGRRQEHAIITPNGGPGLELSFLGASWRHAVDSASFVAVSFGRGATLFLAMSARSEGGVAVVRFALTGSKAATVFSIDNALTQAQVSPPRPFLGTGTYRAAPDGTTTWTGTLSVNFPGAGHFPLAGPPFKASVGSGF